MSDLQIVDDRHTTGMRGSGSVSTIAEQGVAPLTHLQVAGATVRVDAAGLPVGRTADLIDTKEAADLSAGVGGGTSLQHAVPVQRIERDIKALNLHAITHPTQTSNRTGGWPAGPPPHSIPLKFCEEQ
ncbi:hypothetical protein ABZY03_05485 [Streptomyces klenkii]|uniref:hypothetical protein n=1 Tax=Streptomyces klenkii TaxID=1420899 RepID=UPI0033B2F591